MKKPFALAPSPVTSSHLPIPRPLRHAHHLRLPLCRHSRSRRLPRPRHPPPLLLRRRRLPCQRTLFSHISSLDAASADLAVRALCSAVRLDDTCALFRRLSSSPAPVLPDAFTYNFLIRRLARFRPVSSVYAFIDELRRSSGIRPDLATYTILIDAVCRGRNLREATRLLGVLSDADFKPDCCLYNTIMKGYCMVDQCSEVMEVYNKMKDEGVEPDLVTYNTLVYGLSKAGMVD